MGEAGDSLVHIGEHGQAGRADASEQGQRVKPERERYRPHWSVDQ